MSVVADFLLVKILDFSVLLMKPLSIYVMKQIRRFIAWKRNESQCLPEDGYHRPDVEFPKRSLLDRIDDVLVKWIEKINELKK